MNIKKELPEGWGIVKLGTVVQVLDNLRKPINRTERKEKNVGKDISQLYPYYGATGQVGLIDSYITDGEYILVGEDGAPFLDLYKSKAYKIKGKTWVNNHAHILKGIDGVTVNEFILYYLNSIDYRPYVNGTTRLKLTKGSLVQILFPLPSIQEQQRIVGIIEELFSELDKGIENLKIAQQQLKVYRQAILKWAFINDTFKPYFLKDITEKIQIGPFGTQLHKEDYIENGIPLINPTHIKNGLIVADKSFTILESKRESLPNYILKEGDVIMGRRGEMGRCGLVSKKEAGWFCGTGSLYFRPNLKLIDPVFLYYNLRSEPVKKYLDDNAGGTTMANLNLKIVNNIPITIPDIKEQKIIVQEIESRLSVCDNIEETITNSLLQAESLRQSILKKAFEGKLVKAQVQPIYKPKNTYFYQMQLLGIVAAASKGKGINHGEMTIAKYAYLLDKVYQIPTYYEYKRWHLGPYPPEIKKAINNSKFFTKKDNAIAVKDIDTLTKYTNPYTDELNNAVNDLSDIFLAYAGNERSNQIELLATVCKVIEDIQSTDLGAIRQSMAEWKIDLATTHFKNKAEKFSEQETIECLALISDRGWNKILMSN